MTVPSTIDAAGWLGKYLEGDDGDVDLARAMLQAFAETLMSAEASAACGAGYNERSEERQLANGYRPAWDTRAGSIDLAVPKLRQGSYFPRVAVHAASARRTGAGGGDRPGICRRGVHPPGR